MGTLYRNGIPYVGSGGAGGVEVTQAEYDALPESEKLNGSIYFITDGSVSYPTASQMRYDNTESGIPSTSVQGAIDELKIEIGDTDISSIGDGTVTGAVNALNNGLMPKLSYTSITELIGYFSKHPTQSTTNSYTFTEDGFVYLYGIRGNGFGFTLKVNIDGEDWYNFPAEQNYATASLLFPVYKGQTMRIYTDSAGETWGVLRVDFIK